MTGRGEMKLADLSMVSEGDAVYLKPLTTVESALTEFVEQLIEKRVQPIEATFFEFKKDLMYSDLDAQKASLIAKSRKRSSSKSSGS